MPVSVACSPRLEPSGADSAILYGLHGQDRAINLHLLPNPDAEPCSAMLRWWQYQKLKCTPVAFVRQVLGGCSSPDEFHLVYSVVALRLPQTLFLDDPYD